MNNEKYYNSYTKLLYGKQKIYILLQIKFYYLFLICDHIKLTHLSLLICCFVKSLIYSFIYTFTE